MPSPVEERKSNEEGINKDLYDAIYKKVTKKTHNHESPKKNGDGTIKKCIELFKKEANPNVLIELEKSLKKQEESYNYYTKNFLPVLKAEITNLKELGKKQQAAIVQTILDITNRSSDKDHSSSTIQNQNGRRNNQIDRQDNALELFKNKSFSSEVAISTSSDMTPQEKDSVGKGVSGKGISGTYNPLRSSGYYSASTTPTLKQLQASEEKVSIAQSQLNGSFSQSCEDLENKNPSTIADAVEVPRSANTSKLSNDNGSDSGVSSREESLESPINSRRSSMSSILSSAGENNNSQKGDTEDQIQQEQDALEEPQVQESGNSSDQRDQVKNGVSPGVIQVADTEIQREKNMDPDGQATQMTGSQPLQPEEKKNTAPIVQKPSANKNNSKGTPPEKQPNNRNLHVALIAGCALSTIGCIVAGAMTSGLIGVGLFAVAAVCAIGVVAELHSNFLSSKLTSISVEPHVNDKELTACSRL